MRKKGDPVGDARGFHSLRVGLQNRFPQASFLEFGQNSQGMNGNGATAFSMASGFGWG